MSLALALALGPAPAGAQQPPPSPPRRGLPLRALFSPPDGVLSPGYPDRHAGRSGPFISYASEARSRPPGASGPPGPREEPAPVLALLFNPALFFVGKWSARVELAPLRHLSAFVEGSVLKIGVPPVDEKLNGSSYDVGIHLLPNGNRLNGVYLGPRYFRGRGSTSDGQYEGTLEGYGADVGAYFVAGVVSLNLGIGIGYAKVVARPTDENTTFDSDKVEVNRRVVVPLATLGLGFGF